MDSSVCWRRPRWAIPLGLWALCLGTLACSAPPRAPEDLESLLGYIFEHMDDDDTTQLVDGLEQLHIYMGDAANLHAARKGFQIKNLNTSAVDALDEQDRSAEGLRGITVVTKSPNCVLDLAALLT
ncbi:MAG: hypothetical protein VX589_09490, partial [Myxococcota bacterium]|nr:hypothetical protein [Myxococcota bacterium]